MRNDDLALCLWAHDVWGTISRNPLEKGQGRDPDMRNAKYRENGWK